MWEGNRIERFGKCNKGNIVSSPFFFYVGALYAPTA